MAFFNIKKRNKKNISKIKQYNKLIEENFFVIDSNDLENIESHMYGFSISQNGILTDNYYKHLGYYEEPESLGAFVMIRKIGNEIKINQDFFGSFGLYIYENKNEKYFALSNSFLLLEEYLIGKQNISFNKDFADNFIISELCTPSIYETMIKEIIKLPSNTVIIINIIKKNFQLLYIDYEENTVPLESEEGLKIIDNWVDKWTYIIRSLKRQTNNFAFDLSGGFDSRIVISLLMSSGIDLNTTFIKSINDKKFVHNEDFQIAKNISSKFGFKLNENHLDNKSTLWSTKDSLSCTIYSKLGVHKEFYIKNCFYNKPRFVFTGNGGETIRGKPGYSIDQYLKQISSKGKKIFEHEKEFYNSSMRLCWRSIDLLKREKSYNNEFEISSAFYSKGRARNHFGKSVVEAFLANIYILEPIIDPDIQKIKFDINGKFSHDLIAYIYFRFSHDLISFSFQGNRTLSSESIKKASKLNNQKKTYEIKLDLNEHFYIDFKRKSPILPSTKNNKDVDQYLKDLFKTSTFIQSINKVYDNSVYIWAKNYSKNTNFFPLKHGYGLLAIAMAIEYLSLNKKYLNKQRKFY